MVSLSGFRHGRALRSATPRTHHRHHLEVKSEGSNQEVSFFLGRLTIEITTNDIMPRPITPFLVLGWGPVHVQNMSFPIGIFHSLVRLGVDADFTPVEGIHAGYVSEGVGSHLTSIDSPAAPVVTSPGSLVARGLTWLPRLADVQLVNVPRCTLEVEPTDSLAGGDKERIKTIGTIESERRN